MRYEKQTQREREARTYSAHINSNNEGTLTQTQHNEERDTRTHLNERNILCAQRVRSQLQQIRRQVRVCASFQKLLSQRNIFPVDNGEGESGTTRLGERVDVCAAIQAQLNKLTRCLK